MDLRHLKYFVAVAEERSFTRAAERLHISQPPLSRQIRQLEEEIGQPLIDREARPLHLTEVGRFFYEHAVRLLEQFHETITMTRRIAQMDKRLVVGFAPSTMYDALPRIMRMFRAAQPHTELVLLERSSAQQIEEINAGRIDVGFGRFLLENPNVKREVLCNEPLVLAIPYEHSLAHDTGPLSLTAIKPYPLLIYPRQPRPGYADQVLSICRDAGIEPSTVHEINEMQTALNLVASGMGVCVVPSGVQKLRREDVVYRALIETNAVSPIIMSTRLHDNSPGILLLRSLINEVYQSLDDLKGVYPGPSLTSPSPTAAL